MQEQERVFACDMLALTAEERRRYAVLTRNLFAGIEHINELPNGIDLEFTATASRIRDAAEFISYERLCCPFLDFEIRVNGERLSLCLSGEEGVKDFIKAELDL